MSGPHFNKNLQFDPDLWSNDLKINGNIFPSSGNHSAKFGNFQSKGSKDISEQHLVFPLITQLVQNNTPHPPP